MKLDRNVDPEGHGKYALLLLRQVDLFREPGPFGGGLPKHIGSALETLEKEGILDWGNTPETEFFVIRLKDQYANEALEAYANEAGKDDPDYADEVRALADRAGRNSPFCKRPD